MRMNYRGTSQRKSFLNKLLDVCLYMGRIYAFLVKYQSDGILLLYVNHSHVKLYDWQRLQPHKQE